ncbi:hypothetical protein GCM10027610_061610 [Dactylosporangium cerinum]
MVVATPFFLEVGLSAADTSGGGTVAPGPLTLPPGDVEVTVSLGLDGFRTLGMVGETVALRVVDGDPLPVEAVRIMAVDDPVYKATRQIQASYHIGGQLLGVAWRSVQVRPAGAPERGTGAALNAADPPRGAEATVDAADPPRGAGAAAHPPRFAVAAVDAVAVVDAVNPEPEDVTSAWTLDANSADAADLYLLVGEANRPDMLAWTILSPRPGVAPARPAYGKVGDATAQFVANAYRNIDRGQVQLDLFLRDLGRTVADAIPGEVWRALSRLGPGAAVMLATADPYVPWELAQLPSDLRRPGQDVLGGYADVGRWLTGVHRNQAKVPPARLDAATMTTVSGEYTRDDLPLARQEAAELRRAYGARAVEATKPAVTAMLRTGPAPDIVHFAIHGKFDAFGMSDGMLLTDGSYLTSNEVGGAESFRARVVFLNACQLGQATDSLGQSAGMAAAFTGLGVGAAVAPLWKVDDQVAYEVGTGFYEAVFGGGSPAAYLRGQRGAEGRHPSRLAYLFFGHPRLRVTWRGPVPATEEYL